MRGFYKNKNRKNKGLALALSLFAMMGLLVSDISGFMGASTRVYAASDTASMTDVAAKDSDEKSLDSTDLDATSWMSAIADETTLSNISIPGTHDSGTQYIPLGYIFQCQDSSIASQMEDGFRYFDIRLELDGKEGQEELILCHNFAKCKSSSKLFSKALTFSSVLEDAYAFLDQHPSETLIFCMKAENGDDDLATLQTLMYQQIDANKKYWYMANENPTLGDVRGKIVLATRFEDAIGRDDNKTGLHFFWSDQGDVDVVDVPYVMSEVNEDTFLWTQDRYNYDTGDKIDAITDDFENCQASEDTFSLNFTSTSGKGKIGHPKKYASTINDYILSYEFKENTCYGIVVVDFANASLAEKIYATNEFVSN